MEKLKGKLAGLKHALTTDTTLCRAGRGIVRGAKAFPSASGRYMVQKVPAVQWLPQYAPQWIVNDIVAGVTVGLVLLPQALSFTFLARVPLESGLIATIAPAVIYAFMGTAKDISTGPTLTIAGQTASVVALFAPSNVPPAIVASMLAFSMGILSLIFGVLKLGFLLDFLSIPVLTGFMMAQVLNAVFSQIPQLLGEEAVVFSAVQSTEIMTKIATSQPLTIAIGFSGVVVLFLLQFLGKKFGQQFALIRIIAYMRSFLVLIISTAISFFVNKDLEKPIWTVTGTIPRGALQPSAPIASLIGNLIFLSFPIFGATALEHLALARSFGRINGYTIDASQEMVYLGVSNMANGVMGGMAVGGNIARTAINNASGVKTPLSGVFTTLFMVLAIYELNTVLFYTPVATIAAVSLVALLDVNPPNTVFGKYWKSSFADFIAMIIAFNIGLTTTAEIGTGLAVVYSMLYTLLRIMFSHAKPVTRTDLENQYGTDPTPLLQNNNIPPGTQVMALSQHVIFLNAYRMKRNIMDQVQIYHNGVMRETKKSERVWSDLREKEVMQMRRKAKMFTPTKLIPPLHVLILDFTHTTFIDLTGMTMLEELKTELRTWGGEDIEFRFVGLCPKVLERFNRSGWALADSETYMRGELETDVDVRFELLKLAIQAPSRVRDSAGLDFGFDTGNVMMMGSNSGGTDNDMTGLLDEKNVIKTNVYTRNGRAYSRNSS